MSTAKSPGNDRGTSTPSPAWWADPLTWVELFALSNVGFLAVDIYVAHSVNAFAKPAEWVPVVFSLVAPVVLVATMALGGLRPAWNAADPSPARRVARVVGLFLGFASVVVGVAGLILHLDSAFFEEQTLKNLVYAAPFVAPLAYAGVGLLLVLDRMVDPRTAEWSRWVVLLALGGFIGNFVLSLTDHAQNGFFRPTEWIGVVSSAWAIGCLVAVLAYPRERATVVLAALVMAAQMAVGLLGFYYHVAANLTKPGTTLWERFVYGAPAFAPLLLNDLALLAGIALWALVRQTTAVGHAAEVPRPATPPAEAV